jgi:hypothetical protein
MAARIQLKRKKGWKLPTGAINCARPTKRGNPFLLGQRGLNDERRDRLACIADYGADFLDCLDGRNHHLHHPNICWTVEHMEELRGHDLACYCRPIEPCHCDILLEVANGSELEYRRTRWLTNHS